MLELGGQRNERLTVTTVAHGWRQSRASGISVEAIEDASLASREQIKPPRHRLRGGPTGASSFPAQSARDSRCVLTTKIIHPTNQAMGIGPTATSPMVHQLRSKFRMKLVSYSSKHGVYT